MGFARRSLFAIAVCVSLTGCKNILSGSSADGSSTSEPGFAPGLGSAPGTFEITDARAENNSILVSFRTSSSAIRYDVFYRLAGAGSYSRISDVTSPYRITGTQNGSAYEVYVEAVNERGTRASSVVSVTPSNPSSRMVGSVPGATAVSTTLRGYKASSSSGAPTDQLRATTSRGYKVQISVQGQTTP